MSQIAGYLAKAIERDLGEPVFLGGTSTGGSVALQLAVDRPDLVRRLVVISAAYRLGASGRELQAELARLIRAGQPRQAWASVMTARLPPPLRGPVRPLSWLAVGSMVHADPMDVLVTVDSEDAFDVEADLPRIIAPTLIIGGAKDPFYSRELFEGTAARVQDGRVHIFPSWGHGRAVHVRSHHSPHPRVHALRRTRSRRSLTEGGHKDGPGWSLLAVEHWGVKHMDSRGGAPVRLQRSRAATWSMCK